MKGIPILKGIIFLMFILCPILGNTQFKSDTSHTFDNAGGKLQVYIKVPVIEKHKGVIIVLPGWKLPVQDWCNKTTFCEKALSEGYILIMPEMAKSIYAQKRYTETRKDWLQFATREWFNDTLIRYFQQKHQLLLPGQNNYILGLSTGARGVALLCLDNPQIFKKGAGLSGDYDQTQMPDDALIKGWYGPYNLYPERWKSIDNVVYRFRDLTIPLYLGHGKADRIVPVSQTIQLGDSLKKNKPSLVQIHIDENAGHDYQYWNSEVESVLAFFRKTN